MQLVWLCLFSYIFNYDVCTVCLCHSRKVAREWWASVSRHADQPFSIRSAGRSFHRHVHRQGTAWFSGCTHTHVHLLVLFFTLSPVYIIMLPSLPFFNVCCWIHVFGIYSISDKLHFWVYSVTKEIITAIWFQAQLRMDRHLTQKQRMQRVEEVMQEVRLNPTLNTPNYASKQTIYPYILAGWEGVCFPHS